jgi:hypothetical protein
MVCRTTLVDPFRTSQHGEERLPWEFQKGGYRSLQRQLGSINEWKVITWKVRQPQVVELSARQFYL